MYTSDPKGPRVIVPYPSLLIRRDTFRQQNASSLVGLMSAPHITVLYVGSTIPEVVT